MRERSVFGPVYCRLSGTLVYFAGGTSCFVLWFSYFTLVLWPAARLMQLPRHRHALAVACFMLPVVALVLPQLPLLRTLLTGFYYQISYMFCYGFLTAGASTPPALRQLLSESSISLSNPPYRGRQRHVTVAFFFADVSGLLA